jgi:hypothetical protein
VFPIGLFPSVARPSGCRIDIRLDAWYRIVIAPELSIETNLDAAA